MKRLLVACAIILIFPAFSFGEHWVKETGQITLFKTEGGIGIDTIRVVIELDVPTDTSECPAPIWTMSSQDDGGFKAKLAKLTLAYALGKSVSLLYVPNQGGCGVYDGKKIYTVELGQ